MKKIGLLIHGYKGLSVLDVIKDKYDVSFAVVAKKKETDEEELGVKVIDRKDLTPEIFESVDFVFCIGWLFLIPNVPDNMIVFHDSLLPEYRGFCPTVSALINGEEEIGVTAFAPVEEVDAGPIYFQNIVHITYPIKIETAYDLLIDSYVVIIDRIMESKKLTTVHQTDCMATYSLWRDFEDYNIDWSLDSDRIKRFVDAVGYPYDGARTKYQDRQIIVDDVECVYDKKFVERQPGKIFSIKDNQPEVVCGDGMINIVLAREVSTSAHPISFNRIRQRLGE